MAIKVNGTTVINDSRALQNITSVDSTTKSAIETAGVGGASTIIQEDQSLSSASGHSITFSDYRINIVIISNIKNTASAAYNYLNMRMLNASGTVMTNDHIWAAVRSGHSSLYTSSWETLFRPIQQRISNSGNSGGSGLVVKAYNAFDTDKPTHVETYGFVHQGYDAGDTAAGIGTFYSMNGPDSNIKNSGFRIYLGSNAFASGMKVTKIGVA